MRAHKTSPNNTKANAVANASKRPLCLDIIEWAAQQAQKAVPLHLSEVREVCFTVKRSVYCPNRSL